MPWWPWWCIQGKCRGGQYKVQCGVFEVKANADALVAKLEAAGFVTIVKNGICWNGCVDGEAQDGRI